MMKLPTVQDLKIAEELLKPYKVKLRFDLDLEGGYCLVEPRTVVVGLAAGRKYFWSILCHELAHIIAYENKEHMDYHDSSRFRKLNKKQKRKASWEGEQYVDRLGLEIFNLFNLEEHGFKYIIVYNNKKARNWLWKQLGISNERRSKRRSTNKKM